MYSKSMAGSDLEQEQGESPKEWRTGVWSWWAKLHLNSKMHVYAWIPQMLEQILSVDISK